MKNENASRTKLQKKAERKIISILHAQDAHKRNRVFRMSVNFCLTGIWVVCKNQTFKGHNIVPSC